MKTGDKVIISPDLTQLQDWTKGTVINVENNSFIGIVIAAKTIDGTIFFGRSEMFKPIA